MIYDILEDKLTNAGFTPGESLFRHYMPAETEIGALLRVPLSGVPIDPYIAGWHRVQFQLIIRHLDPVDGMQMALAAAQALKITGPEQYPASDERGAAHLSLFQPATLPIQFPRLDGNGYEFSQHFNAAFGFIALDASVQF
jgi:hypothetical protein